MEIARCPERTHPGLLRRCRNVFPRSLLKPAGTRMASSLQMVHTSYAGILALVLALAPLAAQDLTLTIPPVRTSFDIDNQPVAITASGTISRISHGGGEEVFRLRVTADLADLQANMTAVLRAQLDRSDRCGDRIAIQSATLAPADPASLLTTRLHYERWACVKALGKQITSRLAGGDALVKVKITPKVEADRALKLEPEVGEMRRMDPWARCCVPVRSARRCARRSARPSNRHWKKAPPT